MTGYHLEVEGRCPVCEQDATFISRDPWLRDHFLCQGCGSQPRERALMRILAQIAPNWRELAIHESSPCTAASHRLASQAPGYVASQYTEGYELGSMHPEFGQRVEDLERQTFEDARFDIVVTQDVFEHVFAPDRAIEEIARTLKPGGFHICTVPIMNKAEPSVRRARRRRDGAVEHLLPEVYHGNPVDPRGALVTVDWGYDIADYLDRHSGLSTTIWTIEDMSQGISAEYIEVLVSRKPKPDDLTPDGLPQSDWRRRLKAWRRSAAARLSPRR